VGAAFFGVADDYLMAPFVVLAGSLESLLAGAALFHALVAPIAALIGLALGRPMLGLAWGLMLAAFPDLAALSRDYPVNYRTTHWALLAWVLTLLMARPGLDSRQRARLTWTLLLAGALMMASHPLAAAALPTTLVIAVLYGNWRPVRGQLLSRAWIPWWLPAALTVLVCVPYALSNYPAVLDLLLHDRGDQGMSPGAAWRGSLAGIKAVPAEFADFPGGLWVALSLLPGLLLLALSPRGRPALVFTVLWALGSLSTFAVAGYSASPWHLFPLLLPVLGSGLAGWFLFLGDEERWPLVSLRNRLAGVAPLLLIAAALPSLLRALPPTEDAPVRAYATLTDHIVEAGDGRPFQYFEALSRCAVDWSASATVLDLSLRGVQLSHDEGAPLIAVFEDVEALDDLKLPGERARLVLSNRMVVRTFFTEDAGAWISGFRAACGLSREAHSRDVMLEPGGHGAAVQGGTCMLPMPCPSYLKEQVL